MIQLFKSIKPTTRYLIILLMLGIAVFSIWKVFMTEQTYRYQVVTSSPRGYEGLIESTNSYLMDKKGQIITGFGGSRSSGGWGNGVQSSSSSYYPLPASFKVRWYSLAEKQYWEGTFPLPQERIKTLLEAEVGQVDPFMKEPSALSLYSRKLVINVTPGGGVFVWINGHKLEYIGFFQAHKIPPMDWAEMRDYTLGFDVAKETLEQDNLNEAKESLPAEEAAAIAAGKIPGVEHWKRRQQYYDWRFVVDEPFVLKDYKTWYTSGEIWSTYANQTGQYHHEAVPQDMMFVIEDKAGKRQRLSVDFNQTQLMDDFEEMGKNGQKITLKLKIADDLSTVAAFIGNDKISKEFDPLKADVWDLYD